MERMERVNDSVTYVYRGAIRVGRIIRIDHGPPEQVGQFFGQVEPLGRNATPLPVDGFAPTVEEAWHLVAEHRRRLGMDR